MRSWLEHRGEKTGLRYCSLVALAALGAGFVALTHVIFGIVIVLWVWQERTNHAPLSNSASAIECIVFGLWFIVPTVFLVWLLRDTRDLSPGAVAASTAVLGVVELWAAVMLFVNI